MSELNQELVAWLHAQGMPLPEILRRLWWEFRMRA